MKLLLLFGLVALSGCATKQAATSYWTTKAGAVTVHHLVGKFDTTEKLQQKQLNKEQVKSAGLPQGKYYQVAEGHEVIASPSPTPKKNENQGKGAELAEVTSQIKDLKRQVKAVREENQQLQQQLQASQKPAAPQTAQVEEQSDVRVSQ
jgi:hypothetical protein